LAAGVLTALPTHPSAARSLSSLRERSERLRASGFFFSQELFDQFWNVLMEGELQVRVLRFQ
jgi:hypothetical protein